MSEDQFAHTPEYQVKTLAYMAHDPQFARIAGDTLEGEDFGDKARQWFFNALAKAAKQGPALTYVTLKEEMIRAAKDKTIKKDELEKFVHTYKLLGQPPVPQEKEHIRNQLSSFMKAQALKRVILGSADLIKNNQFESMLSEVQAAVNRGFDVMDHGIDYFDSYQERAANRSVHEEVVKLLTGIPLLDMVLNGGTKLQQVGLIVGGTGRGKSIFLAWLARVAVLLGKTVVYFSLELSEDEISNRFDSMFAHIRPNELVTLNDDFLHALNPLAQKYAKRLWIKKYPAGKASLHVLENYLQVLSSQGVVPDLVLIDYLDLLKPHIQRHAKHEELEDIATYMVGMAESFNTRIWTATQLNRFGYAMETPDETAIAGALAKLFPIDIGLFLAQTKDERVDEIMRLVVAKNRNGRAGVVLSLDTDYGYMTFFNEQTMRVEEVKEADKKAKKKPPTKDNEETTVERSNQRPDERELDFDGPVIQEDLGDDDGFVITPGPGDRDMLVVRADGSIGPPLPNG
jgi:replicative DNA helicase